MKTVTCPNCGLGFETATTTNTRCRRCHKVVRVGPSPRRAAPAEPDDGYDDEDGYYDEDDEPASAGAGGALALVGVAAAVGLGLWWASRAGKAPGTQQPPPETGPPIVPPSDENPFRRPEI